MTSASRRRSERHPVRAFGIAGLLGGLLIAAVGCGDDGSAPSLDPARRAVGVVTVGCGDASSVTASGVLVISGRVVTAAHVVVGSAGVTVVDASGVDHPADVEVLDRDADVAVLRVETLDAPAVAFTRFDIDDVAHLVGGASTPMSDLVVTKVARIEIDTVRSASRSVRDGYELVGVSADGDSGAGLYDDDGRLGAIVFAASSERDRVAFAVASSEIDQALDAPTATYRCDPDDSQLIVDGGAIVEPDR